MISRSVERVVKSVEKLSRLPEAETKLVFEVLGHFPQAEMQGRFRLVVRAKERDGGDESQRVINELGAGGG